MYGIATSFVDDSMNYKVDLEIYDDVPPLDLKILLYACNRYGALLVVGKPTTLDDFAAIIEKYHEKDFRKWQLQVVAVELMRG